MVGQARSQGSTNWGGASAFQKLFISPPTAIVGILPKYFLFVCFSLFCFFHVFFFFNFTLVFVFFFSFLAFFFSACMAVRIIHVFHGSDYRVFKTIGNVSSPGDTHWCLTGSLHVCSLIRPR